MLFITLFSLYYHNILPNIQFKHTIYFMPVVSFETVAYVSKTEHLYINHQKRNIFSGMTRESQRVPNK